RIDEAEGLQVEEAGRVIGVVKDVGGVLEDRGLSCAGQGLRLSARVDHAGFEAVIVALAHDSLTFRRRAVITCVSKPPQASSAFRRPNSIFGQRFITTLRPAASARSAAASSRTPSCIHTTSISF